MNNYEEEGWKEPRRIKGGAQRFHDRRLNDKISVFPLCLVSMAASLAYLNRSKASLWPPLFRGARAFVYPRVFLHSRVVYSAAKTSSQSYRLSIVKYDTSGLISWQLFSSKAVERNSFRVVQAEEDILWCYWKKLRCTRWYVCNVLKEMLDEFPRSDQDRVIIIIFVILIVINSLVPLIREYQCCNLERIYITSERIFANVN